MMRLELALVMLMVLMAADIAHVAGDVDKAGGAALRVMSFNIRLGVAKDGENRWDLRRPVVIKTIKQFGPDLLGTQETWAFQAEYLQKHLPGYVYYGVGRQADPAKGEQCGLMYLASRFDLIDKGTFWLSQTPKVAGSKNWDSSLPRIVSWVRLRDKRNGGREIVFLNTHFDHRGRRARLEGAKIIRSHVAGLGPGAPFVITGDFNAGEGSDPYEALVGMGKGGDDEATIIDSYRAARPKRGDKEGTFGAWKGRRTGPRIDWILHSSHFKTEDAAIDLTNDDGRYPSDHFPVTAVLSLN